MLSLSVFSSRTEFRNVLPIALSTSLKVTVFSPRNSLLVNMTVLTYAHMHNVASC